MIYKTIQTKNKHRNKGLIYWKTCLVVWAGAFVGVSTEVLGGAQQGGAMRSRAFKLSTTTQAVSYLSAQTFCDLSLPACAANRCENI